MAAARDRCSSRGADNAASAASKALSLRTPSTSLDVGDLADAVPPVLDSEITERYHNALFLFDVEEINPVYRLMMRNKAMLRGKRILDGVLRCWPYYNTHSHG